ncbi:MAG TPA: uroporphyrinogen-III synthase [Lacibacter sp.]|nr:uroporphyrinogen-III synthase [Lacibacter sp.]HMO88707.1 uroporphyrinogen-III synthase [Lacibacter sp.]HMP86593.1 uroporphyrinogen-III synthase [Lacibacter sp.]
MQKKAQKSVNTTNAIRNILITQPRPENDKSPYYELERKYNVSLSFHPFIRIEGVSAKEFRKQKIDIASFSAVIFTSRHAIDHFFRICEEMRITIAQETKYFCITEAVALYLQKFILYRKRKVFYGADGSNKSLFDVMNKHKSNERFLFPCSENMDNEVVNWLRNHNCEYAVPVLYKTVSCEVKEILEQGHFDVICFFTPSGVRSLFENIPGYRQNGTLIGAFGLNTFKAVADAGLELQIKAPEPQAPSMVSALDKFLAALNR